MKSFKSRLSFLLLLFTLFSFSVQADDICYDTPYEKNQFLTTTSVIPIKHTDNNSTLSDIQIIYAVNGLSFPSVFEKIGIDDEEKTTNADGDEAERNNDTRYPFFDDLFIHYDKGYNFRLDDMSNGDEHETWTSNFFLTDLLNDFFSKTVLYAEYTKDGVQQTVILNPCTGYVPDASVDDENVTSTSSDITMTFTVDISGELDDRISDRSRIHYYTQDGTAKAGDDYISAEGDIEIMAGDTSADIDITVKANSSGEFYLILDYAHGARIVDGNATGTITNNFKCANPKEFTQIFSVNTYAKLLQIGNTSLCKKVNGACVDPGTSTNNDINMSNNDYDDVNGTSDNAATTLNSSAAYLDMPAGKKVLWAGLFWQGYMVDWTLEDKEKGKSIKFKHHDDSSYQIENNASMHWVYLSDTRLYYESFVDVTEYVNDNGPGYYWVGDIATSEGTPEGGTFGAWTMSIVYEDNTEEFRNITVFHGYQIVSPQSGVTDASNLATTNGCDTTNTGATQCFIHTFWIFNS
jgi:hypothetical protein